MWELAFNDATLHINSKNNGFTDRHRRSLEWSIDPSVSCNDLSFSISRTHIHACTRRASSYDPSPLRVLKVHPGKPNDEKTREELICEIELMKGKSDCLLVTFYLQLIPKSWVNMWYNCSSERGICACFSSQMRQMTKNSASFLLIPSTPLYLFFSETAPNPEGGGNRERRARISTISTRALNFASFDHLKKDKTKK